MTVAEVKVGEVFEVDIPVGKALHLSHACLGEAQKGHSHIHLYVYADEGSKKKNVLGSLNPKKLRNLSFNLSFSKSFKLSHSSKEGAVYFHGGFMAGNPTCSLDSGENASAGFIDKVFLTPSVIFVFFFLLSSNRIIGLFCEG